MLNLLHSSDSEKIELVDHTADIGLRLQAASREAIFRLAARGMFSLICPQSGIRAQQQITCNVAGDDDEELLVNWLSELNFLFQTRQFLLADVLSLNVTSGQVRAQITGETVDRQRHEIRLDIKAVTYHKIYLKQINNNSWEAQVIFDV